MARVDLKTNVVAKTISVGKAPCGGILSAFGSLWSPLCGQSAVARVDPKKDEVSATFPSSLAADFTAIASGVGSVWLLTDNKGTLVRIDPATNTTVAEIYLPPGANAMAFGQDALWITCGARDVLVRLNPYTNLVVETIKVGKGPRSVAIGEGAVWTLNQVGTVSRVDPKTNKVAETIQDRRRRRRRADRHRRRIGVGEPRGRAVDAHRPAHQPRPAAVHGRGRWGGRVRPAVAVARRNTGRRVAARPEADRGDTAQVKGR